MADLIAELKKYPGDTPVGVCFGYPDYEMGDPAFYFHEGGPSRGVLEIEAE